MDFPKLYSQSSTGAALEWQIFVEDDYFYTVAGQIDGKKVTSAPNYCQPKNVGKKNETTAHEQAIAEAQSKWEKKLKTDYHLSLQNIGKAKFLEPMLAKIFKDRLDKVYYPVIVDQKLNGMRLATLNGQSFSRKGEVVATVPHFAESLAPLFAEFPNAVVDGEAYNHDYRHQLNELMKILRKTKNISEQDLLTSRQKVKYYVYDGYGFAGIEKDTPQFERRAKLIAFFEKQNFDFIEVVHGQLAKSEQEVWSIYEKFVEEEYEGAMVRLNGPYKNSRSSDLLKLKPESDDEGTILEVIEGSGNWGGVAKIFTISWRGKTFNATIKGSHEDCLCILQNPQKWIGKEVTFIYNDLTGLGVPNYARVDVNNCFKK